MRKSKKTIASKEKAEKLNFDPLNMTMSGAMPKADMAFEVYKAN